MKTALRICTLILILSILVNLSCKKDSNPSGPSGPTGSTDSTTDVKFVTGPSIQLGSQTIGTGGGTFTISRSGDRLNGMQIIVPEGAYSGSKTFSVTYRQVGSHQLGASYSPLSPLITISNGGGYSDIPMQVKIPVTVPSGTHASAFFYDKSAGGLTVIPVVARETGSITVATSHFPFHHPVPGKEC